MESYSVEAILSAVDKNFSSTMKNADSSMNNLDSSTQKTNTSILDIAKGIGVFKLIDNAIGLVTSSLGGAIDRFDTLNKYPVVMQALGYSAEEVDKSMNKLTDGIDGLPTSLDEIVSSAQQLAISTGDLQKGTDTAVALNNAFLASGASAADASRGAQQYQQMLSKGEVDLQSWRSLLETMPIAMDKVSKSFSDQGVNSANDLYAALKKGDITFDDFNSRLIELNEGVGGFAELAQKNSAGIRTSFANIKTAVVKGLANVITAIDEGMQDAGLGPIAENFDKIKGAVNVAFQAITDSIPPAISFLTTLWDTIKPFLPLIMAVIGYISIYQGVMGTARKAVELYNGAQKMMNVLMNLNPIGLVIAAVIALVAGFIYLWNTSEGFRNFWIGLWEGIQSVVGAAVDWIVSAWNGMTEFFSNAWDGLIEGSKQAVDSVKKGWQNTKQWFSDLWQGIKDSASDMWQGTKQAFSDGVDNIVSVWDGITQWFSDLWNGIKSTVTSIVKGIADGIMSRFGTLVYGVRNAFIHMSFFLKTLWTNLVKIAGQIFEIMKNVILAPVLFVTSLISGGWEEAMNNMIGIWTNIQTAAGNIWASIQAIFDSFLTNTQMAFLNIWNGIKAALAYIWTTIQTIAIDTFNSIVAFFVETWTNIKQGTIDAWNALKTWLSETWESMKQGAIDTWNSVKQFFIDLWESIKTNTINMWNAIKDGVTTAWENTKNAVINTAKSIVDGAAQAWEDMKTGVSNAVDRVKETFDTIRQIDLLQIGKDIIDGLVNGIRSKIDDVVNAVKDVAGSITGKIKDVLNIHSPSRVMAELGMFTSQGLAEGMLDGSKYVDKASSTLADKASNMDIGNRISAVNSQIQSKVQHEVSYGTNNKPALFNIQIGNQSFQAFVDDISQAQGGETAIQLQF
ncbi:tape measure domain-containing protein [Enterococcus casseliflavus]|uniref:phage tail protein n=1 Tax=Enterococcus casseliflavus TaxID=37734 RepID=UPI0008F39F50|nr:tape measure protein [Enterococcus casseliflavus]SFE40663.1 tape measure domain-containing protein [Enterococcus casseliflavus]